MEIFGKLESVARAWQNEATVLERYGDERIAVLLRRHADLVLHLVERERRELAPLLPRR